MKLSDVLAKTLPTLNRTQTCPACGQQFACEIGIKGCWCLDVPVSPQTLAALREQYHGCLCRECLEKAEAQHSGFA